VAPPTPPTYADTRLLWQADPILVLATQLRTTSVIADLARLRTRIAGMFADFQVRAREGGIEASRIAQATDVLSALIDHVVTSMPWGADAGWRSVGKSSRSSSSRRPAERLLEIARDCASDVGLSELIVIALGLGFDKRSRGVDDPQIEQLLDQLMKRHWKVRTPAEQRLSPELPASVQHRKAWTTWLPLWVSALAVAALLAVLFFALELSLGATSDRLYARLAALQSPAAIARRPLLAATPRLAGALATQVEAGNMFVRDEIDRSVIVVPDAKLFDADSPTLRPRSADVLRPIVTALLRTPGRIQVIGHTDGTAPRSARFPSEWEFSVDRARTVQAALRELGIEASRITYDGRANIEPLLPDDRARAVSGAGRVEIVLLAGR
jgi:type VI secretion system protein ImpK